MLCVIEHVRANGDNAPPSAVPWGIDVTGTDFYYNHWLKGSVRLLQGIAPLIQNTTRPTRMMLVEDGWLRMNGANCGAKCAVTNAVHDTFTQMRRAMLRSDSTSTSSVITVLKPGLLNNATTATSVLSQAIWESVVQVLHPVPTIGWLDQWRLRRVANISSSEIIRKNTRVYGVQVPSQLVVSVSGDHSEDKLTIDLGCDFALKWFEGNADNWLYLTYDCTLTVIAFLCRGQSVLQGQRSLFCAPFRVSCARDARAGGFVGRRHLQRHSDPSNVVGFFFTVTVYRSNE